MARYVMVVDVGRCCGCFNCQIACKDEYVGNDHPPYSASQPETGHFWMRVREIERGAFPKVKLSYIAELCMHCEKAPCQAAAQDDAIYTRRDGIVIIDPKKSRGQRQIVASCPYGKIYWNEAGGIPQKCTFCAHLLDAGWKEPRCVEACPTGALIFGDAEDTRSRVSELLRTGRAEPLQPEFGVSPKVYYISLPKVFIAGSVVSTPSDDYLGGAQVTLTNPSTGERRKVATDNFGQFEFEGPQAGETYLITIEAPAHRTMTLGPLKLAGDTYLGDVLIEGA